MSRSSSRTITESPSRTQSAASPALLAVHDPMAVDSPSPASSMASSILSGIWEGANRLMGRSRDPSPMSVSNSPVRPAEAGSAFSRVAPGVGFGGFRAIPDVQSVHVWTGERGLHQPVVRAFEMEHGAMNERDDDSELRAIMQPNEPLLGGLRPFLGRTETVSGATHPIRYAPLSPFSEALREGSSAGSGTTGRSSGSIQELGSGRASAESIGSQ